MCAVCRKNPCDSRCPNAEEPKSIYTCEWCKEPIYEGDKYMDTPEGQVCNCLLYTSFLDEKIRRKSKWLYLNHTRDELTRSILF